MTISKDTLAAIGELVYSSEYNNTKTSYYRFDGSMYEVVEKNTGETFVEELKNAQ